MSVRWVIVDDTDPAIQYAGPWFNGSGQTDSLGNFGPPFQGTSHGVSSSAYISYIFNGSRVRAFGTCEGSKLYQWECFVDNISIGSNPPTDDPENNWILCDSDSLADGQHNFTLRVTVSSNDFWFDQIQYVPTPGMALGSSLILVNASDSGIQYAGAGWQDMGRIVAWDMSYYTTLPNLQANMTFDFDGTGLKWFSVNLNDTALTSVIGSSYTLDGEAPVAFLLPPVGGGGPVHYNQLAFQVSNLNAGPHRLSVSHFGDVQTIPLTLNYLIVQNPDAIAGATPTVGGTPTASFRSPSSSSSNTGGSNSSSPASNKHRGSPLGAIVGGAMGGVIVMVAIILLLLRRQRRRKDADQGLNQGTLSNNFEPFNTPPTSPISFRKFSAGDQLPSSSSAVPNTTSLTGLVAQHPSKFRTIPPGSPLLTSPGGNSNESSGLPAIDNLTPGNSRPREAGELREPLSTNLLSVPPDIPLASNSHSAAPQRVMWHEDSGVRLPATRESMVEFPPLYTAL